MRATRRRAANTNARRRGAPDRPHGLAETDGDAERESADHAPKRDDDAGERETRERSLADEKRRKTPRLALGGERAPLLGELGARRVGEEGELGARLRGGTTSSSNMNIAS